jgi:hypothetical protein
MRYRVAKISEDSYVVLIHEDSEQKVAFWGPDSLERAQQYAIWLNDCRPRLLSLAITFMFGCICSATLLPLLCSVLSWWRQ